jgi:tetratricopeptide (TPR) repeat protein
MAPEQALGRPDLIDERTDVYALGAILYEVLTGRPPFTGDDTDEVLRHSVQEPPQPPRELARATPRALQAVCLKALAKDREARYPTVTALAEDVRRWLADEPVAAYREPWSARARRWLGRHRTLVTAAAAALVVAVVSLGTATALLADANRDIREARDRAVKQEAEAQRQRDLARANFRMARDAVEEYGTKVSTDLRLREKDLHSLRQDLLRSAAVFHQKFVEQHADDPSLRADLGRAYRLLAGLTGEIEDASKAIPLEEEALAVFRELTASHPNPEYRHDLARCYNSMGLHRRDSGKFDLAVDAWRKAIAIWEPLVREHPTKGEYATGLGGAFCNLGYVLRQKDDLHAARDSLRQAIRFLEPVCARDPKDEKALKFLAHSTDNLAYNYRMMKQPGEGLPLALKALQMRKRLKRLQPALPDHDGHMAMTLQILASLYQDLGQLAKAEETFREAVAVSKRGAEQHPRVMEAQINRFNSLSNLGIHYLSLDQPEQAIPPLRETVALQEKFAADFPSNTPYRIRLAKNWLRLLGALGQTGDLDEARRAFVRGLRALEAIPKRERQAFPEIREMLVEAYPKYALLAGQLGRHAEAAGAAEAFLKLPDPPADFPYRAACALALAAGAAARDDALTPAERQKLAGQYAARAVELLKQADGAGFFKDATRLRQLRTAPELAPLHTRDDFRQWLSGRLSRPEK